MVVLDARSNEIHIGSFVRYTRTGTISEVVAMETNHNKDWIRLAKDDLWYLSEYMEVLDEKDIDLDAISFKTREKEINVEDLKEIKDDFEDIELSSNVAEGGG